MHYHLKNIEVAAKLGVYDSEKIAPQKILISVEYDFASQASAESDNLGDTVDYSRIEASLHEVCVAEHFELLEKLHADLVSTLENKFPLLSNLTVQIEKFPFMSGSLIVK